MVRLSNFSVGALLTWLDMATVLNSILSFIRHANFTFAKALIAMSAPLFSRSMGTRTLPTEMFYTVTCLSPGFHVYRVASGEEKQARDPRSSGQTLQDRR